MRIIWIADYTIKDYLGGAQITNLEMITAGEKRGHKIIQINHKEIDAFKFRKTDRVVLNNMAILNRDHHDKLMRVILNTRFVRYIHDYDWVYNDMHVSTISGMFKKAKGIIFLSPLQALITRDKFVVRDSVIIPSPVDTKKFYNQHQPRKKNSALYTGEINTHKGINHLYNWALFHPEIQLDLYGWIAHPGLTSLLPHNVKIIEKLPHADITQTLNQYEKFVHLPIWREPFGRAAAEAYLCGCKLVTNGKVGFQSFDWDYKDPKAIADEIAKAPDRFWDYVEEKLA